MRRIAGPAAIAAGGAALATFLSMATAMVVGVVGSMGRYPEMMLDYASPALGAAAEFRAVPVLILAIVLFPAFLLLARRPSIPGAVLTGLGGALVATLTAAFFVLGGVLLGDGSEVRLRMLAESLAIAAARVADLFLVGAPLAVLAAVLLVVWLHWRGLTGSPSVE